MSSNNLENTWINERSRLMSTGSTDISLLENMRGFNHTGQKSFMPKNKDSRGHVFFTRPQLNFSLANLQSNRRFLGLLATDEASMARYVRMMLDPRLLAGYRMDKTLQVDAALRGTGKYYNNEHAFIPLLTNNLLNLSGWPDIVVQPYSRSKELYGAEPTLVAGYTDIQNQVTLNASFRTSTGNPITNMLAYWSEYMGAVFSGDLVPYPDFIVENELDYNTRVWRIITDSVGKYVTNIASTGPGFPETVGIGKLFDFNSEDKYSDTADSADFSFKFHGVEYNDPILVYEFNRTVAIFKKGMLRPSQDSSLVKIPHSVKHLFNYEGYPHINYLTGEFEIYVESYIVNALLGLRTHPDETGDIRSTINNVNTEAAKISGDEAQVEDGIIAGTSDLGFDLI